MKSLRLKYILLTMLGVVVASESLAIVSIFRVAKISYNQALANMNYISTSSSSKLSASMIEVEDSVRFVEY